MKCTNCGASLSCGCQKRTTPDGKQVCTKCVHQVKTKTGSNPPK